MWCVQLLSILGLSVALASAQTQINLKSQSTQVDFTASPFTKPVKMGTTLPASCALGELFFKSDALPGANLYGCIGPDLWLLQGNSLPSQAQATFAVLTSDGINAGWSLLGGDISGSPDAVSVTKLQNRPLSATAPLTGQSLVWNGTSWGPSGTAAGNVGIAVDGTALATRSFINYIAGPGILNTFTDTGTQVNLQQSMDTALLLTRAENQKGATLSCISASASATAYTCTMAPPPQQYTKGMMIAWQADINGTGGSTTLKLNTLAAKNIKLADGTTDPRPNDIKAGQVYPLWYDGTLFRIVTVLPQSAAIAVNGVALASRDTFNFISGSGITANVANTTGQVNVTLAADTTSLLTRAEHQLGTVLACNSASASATVYTCTMSPAPSAYTAGMLVYWKPDIASTGGSVTLNLNGLDAKSLKLADGSTDPRANDIKAGSIYPLWYDGTVLRLVQIQPNSSGANTSRPACDTTQRGQFWLTAAVNGTADTLSVCAKTSADTYVWRGITLN